jgi:hypothetical protein
LDCTTNPFHPFPDPDTQACTLPSSSGFRSESTERKPVKPAKAAVPLPSVLLTTVPLADASRSASDSKSFHVVASHGPPALNSRKSRGAGSMTSSMNCTCTSGVPPGTFSPSNLTSPKCASGSVDWMLPTE